MKLTKEVKEKINNWFAQRPKEEIEYIFNKYAKQQQLHIPIVSVSLFETLQDLIEVYEEREVKASNIGNWSEAFQNEIRVGVLQHLAQLHKHKNNER